ncbi:MAG: hypothetical protein R2991_00785 [Thermoanaerobaculia bacterium]
MEDARPARPPLRGERSDALRRGGASLAPVSALLLLVATLVAGARAVFPLWDDAWLWLLLDEHGPGSVAASFPDRPVNGALWALLARAPGGFWPAAFLLQGVLWLLLGLCAARLWVTLFPRSRRLSWLVACLTVAPVRAPIQLVTANVGLASLPAVVGGWVGVLVLAAFVRHGGRGRAVRAAAGLALLAVAVLFQEYAVAVALAGGVLLASHLGPGTGKAVRHRAAVGLGLLAATTVGSYSWLLRLAEFGLRRDTDPEVALRTGRALLSLPVETLGALGRGLVAVSWVGRHLTTAAAMAAAAAGGLLLALLLLAGAWRQTADGEETGALRASGELLLLLLATLAGLAPFLAMGRAPWDPGDGLTARFALPILPVLTALLVRGSERLLPRRAWPVLVVLGSLLVGAGTVGEIAAAVAERRQLAAAGAALEPKVRDEPDLTVAVVEEEERALGPRRQWELVVRLAESWPRPLRRRLWAYRMGGGPPLYYREEATRVLGPRERCRPPRRLRTGVRLVRREGRVGQLLWLSPEAGGVSTEPYCRRRP